MITYLLEYTSASLKVRTDLLDVAQELINQVITAKNFFLEGGRWKSWTPASHASIWLLQVTYCLSINRPFTRSHPAFRDRTIRLSQWNCRHYCRMYYTTTTCSQFFFSTTSVLLAFRSCRTLAHRLRKEHECFPAWFQTITCKWFENKFHTRCFLPCMPRCMQRRE